MLLIFVLYCTKYIPHIYIHSLYRGFKRTLQATHELWLRQESFSYQHMVPSIQ